MKHTNGTLCLTNHERVFLLSLLLEHLVRSGETSNYGTDEVAWVATLIRKIKEDR